MNVSVKKDVLLSVLENNLKTHRESYEKAFAVWKEDVFNDLAKKIDDIKNTKKPFMVYVHLPVPEEHTKDYERVIRMLEMDTRDVIVLEELEARQYLDDDWGWKGSFTSNTTSYLNK